MNLNLTYTITFKLPEKKKIKDYLDQLKATEFLYELLDEKQKKGFIKFKVVESFDIDSKFKLPFQSRNIILNKMQEIDSNIIFDSIELDNELTITINEGKCRYKRVLNTNCFIEWVESEHCCIFGKVVFKKWNCDKFKEKTINNMHKLIKRNVPKNIVYDIINIIIKMQEKIN